MNSSDTITHKNLGFDADKYFSLQKQHIQERVALFQAGRLYLEVGGKLLFDPHASRVLPGFDPEVKKKLFKEFAETADFIYCIDAKSITENRQLKNTSETYQEVTLAMIKSLTEEIGKAPFIAINLCEHRVQAGVDDYERELRNEGFEVYRRYLIPGYPHDTKKVLSDHGYGKDDYIPVKKKLVIVTGAASNSGKMSTCLGQMYHDAKRGLDSGYAKYETFPIWNLPLNHPVNLAYEAATVDIGDFNMYDTFHMNYYKKQSVNYNRDVAAFEILLTLGQEMLSSENPTRQYHSPTDMGINYAGFAITNDEVICAASLDEIRRRKVWYQEVIDRGLGAEEWVTNCEKLEKKAIEYMSSQKYPITQS